MNVLDPGHSYALAVYDGELDQETVLYFVKREGFGYPGNEGVAPGTNCQEVLRALIDRTKYLDLQKPCAENAIILAGLRSALIAFEVRAARLHGRKLQLGERPELREPCKVCGHLGCPGHECASAAA